MALRTGIHRFGPGNATLEVRTYREGVAAKVGHDLVLAVARWDATLDAPSGEPAEWRFELDADPGSLEIREALRGVKPLSDRDRAEIAKNIDAKVLGTERIRFRSSEVRLEEGGEVAVAGELSLAGSARPVTVRLTVDDGGALRGTFPLTQSDWGIKPYRGLMGALKVRDDVEVVIEAALPVE